ncbi:MAG: MFS transporter [Flavobacteriaceae bacterium]
MNTVNTSQTDRGTRRWIFIVAVARVMLYSNYMVIAGTIPLLRSDWQISSADAGAIITCFTASYAFSLFCFAWLADSIGAKRSVVISAIAIAVTSALFALFARDWLSAVLLYSAAGLSLGGIYSPMIVMFRDEVDPRHLGTAIGSMVASTSFGYSVSLAVTAAGVAIAGWQGAFLATAVLPVLGTVILIAAVWPMENRIHARQARRAPFSDVLKNRDALLLIGNYTFHAWELLGAWGWLSALLAASMVLSGISLADATMSGAVISGVMYIFASIGSLWAGRLSDRLGRRPVIVWISASSAAVSLSLGWLVGLHPVPLAIICVIYATLCISDSAPSTTALSERIDASLLGRVLAIRQLLGVFAGALAPLAVGGVIDLAAHQGLGQTAQWGLSFSILGIGGILSTACARALPRRRPPGAAR